MRMKYFAGAAALAALTMAAAPSAFAQATTGGVTGRVVDDAGKPVAGATVVVTHVPTGASTTTVTNAQGVYTVLNERVGGPYTITVKAKGFSEESVGLATVAIGDPTAADVTVHSGVAVKELTVTGVRNKSNMGPSMRVGQKDLQTLPTLQRDLKDYARLSPYAVLDPTNSNALIINGQNSRSNLITIDGVKQSDTFGLNGNGYPTQRNPISMSVVQSLEVQVAPYDVIYGDFQGGTVNVVTKSGSNDFHGEAFYEYDNNKLRGSSFYAPGADTPTKYTSGFSEKTWGVTLSGPIWKDHAFFVLNYENFTGTSPSTVGPTGSGAPNQVSGVTQADVDAVTQIMESVYHYNPGAAYVTSLPITDHKFFGKLDWDINDQHRLSFEYQKTDGGAFNTTSSGSNSCAYNNTSKPCLALESKDYTLQTNLEVYKAQLFSHWTDAFTTELSYSHQEADNLSTPTTSPFAEFQVFLPSTKFNSNGTPVCTSASPCPSIVLGTDISRQENQLTTKTDQFRIKGDYRLGNHTITAGYELQMVDVFNAFVQRAIGQYVFNCETAANCNDKTYLSNLQGQLAYQLQYANAADNVAADGAAAFKYDQHTAYLQDNWAVLPNLTLRAGLRYDFYTSGSLPEYNAAFQAAYGYPNTKTLDGMDVLQPRLGFNWRPLHHTQVYGGYGLFQGGSPLVWISDSFANPGNLTGFVSCTQLNQAANCPGSLAGVTGGQAGAGAQAANAKSANLGTGNGNAILPGTEPVSLWKATIGVRQDFNLDWAHLGRNWHASAEYVDSQVNNAIYWKDIYMQQFLSGTAPDGRPEYGLTTLPSGKTLYGTSTRLNREDVVMLNTNKGYTDQWTVSLGKDWTEGWLDGLSVNLSYTNTIDQEVNPGTSSVATSNYRQVAFADPNNPGLATSNYEIRNLTKLNVEYDHRWFGDNMTRIGLFVQSRSGLPFSYTFADSSNGANGAASGMYGYNSLYTNTGAELLYIPKLDPTTHQFTCTSDPIVTCGGGFDVSAFNKFLKNTGLNKYAGEIAPRNGFRSRDVTTADLHLSQEIPASIPIPLGKIEAYMDIFNIGNMLDSHWGVLEQAGFPYMLSPVSAQNCQAGFGGGCTKGPGNYYQYNTFTNKPQSSSFGSTSVWQIKVGVRFKF